VTAKPIILIETINQVCTKHSGDYNVRVNNTNLIRKNFCFSFVVEQASFIIL